MEETETAPSEPSFFAKLKASFTQPITLACLAGALALGAGGAALGHHFYLKPIRATAELRYQSHLALMSLYDMQTAYHASNGTFANDLDTLLASAPEGAKLRERLAATMDINTLAVIGDENRFRLEANVLDERRTSVKLRGPLGER